MLTEKQYYALCKYRDNFIPVSSKLDDMTRDLFEHRYIKPKTSEYSKEDDGCIVYYQKSFWELTLIGRDELVTYNEQIAYRKESERQRCIDRILSVAAIIIALLTFISSIVERGL